MPVSRIIIEERTLWNLDTHLTSQPHVVAIRVHGNARLGPLSIESSNPTRQGHGFHDAGRGGAQVVGKSFDAVAIVE